MAHQQENIKKSEVIALEYIIEQEANSFQQQYCKENYYKNVILHSALTNNISLQCVVREYVEGIKYSSNISGNRGTDTLHVNALLSFLKIYIDREKTEEINTMFYHFRQYMTKETPYLIGESEGRIKSLMSFEAKIRSKIAKIEAIRLFLHTPMLLETRMNSLLEIIRNSSDPGLKKIEKSVKEFLDECPSDNSIRNYLDSLIEKHSSLSNIIKDTIGYRFILYSLDKDVNEDEMKNYLVEEFTTEMKNFFWENGATFLPEGFKNYILKPKANNYKSLHFIFEMQDFSFEMQARTWLMHEDAKSGTASHKAYKSNNEVYSFLDKFFIKDMDSQKVAIMALLGITEPLDITNRPWIAIPFSEIPRTFSQVREYENKEIKAVIEKNIFST